MENVNIKIADLFIELLKNSYRFNEIIKELSAFDINLYSQTGNANLVLFIKNIMLEQGESPEKIIETIEMFSKVHLNFGENLSKSLSEIKVEMFKVKEEKDTVFKNDYGITSESYTQTKLAVVLKVSDKTIRSYVGQGLLKEVKIGTAKNSTVKYMREDIIDFLDKNPKNVDIMKGNI